MIHHPADGDICRWKPRQLTAQKETVRTTHRIHNLFKEHRDPGLLKILVIGGFVNEL
jgi:hypothetical protein